MQKNLNQSPNTEVASAATSDHPTPSGDTYDDFVFLEKDSTTFA
jgi:hypothetical protein